MTNKLIFLKKSMIIPIKEKLTLVGNFITFPLLRLISFVINSHLGLSSMISFSIFLVSQTIKIFKKIVVLIFKLGTQSFTYINISLKSDLLPKHR